MAKNTALLANYMHSPRKDTADVAVKNIMANLASAQGALPANRSHVEAQHKMLELYLNGEPGLRV